MSTMHVRYWAFAGHMPPRLAFISARKGTNIVSMSTDIVYAGMALGVRPLKHEISFLDKLLGGGSGGGGAEGGAEDPLRMYATITKAAALGWQYIRQPEFTKWMVERSAAAISDETGLSPSAYRSHIDAAHASSRPHGACLAMAPSALSSRHITI